MKRVFAWPEDYFEMISALWGLHLMPQKLASRPLRQETLTVFRDELVADQAARNRIWTKGSA